MEGFLLVTLSASHPLSSFTSPLALILTLVETHADRGNQCKVDIGSNCDEVLKANLS